MGLAKLKERYTDPYMEQVRPPLSLPPSLPPLSSLSPSFTIVSSSPSPLF